METRLLLNNKILALRTILPSMILEDHFAIRPDMEMKYSDHQKENFKKDVGWILSFLAESVWAGKPVLFEEFISWLKTFLMSVRVPMKDVAESLELIRRRMNVSCTADENEILNPILIKAIGVVLSDDQHLSIPAMDNHLSKLAQNYLDSLLKGDRNMALSIVMAQIKLAVPVQDIYVEVFQPVQYEIGRLWQTNKISVAQEHYCTAATQLVMS